MSDTMNLSGSTLSFPFRVDVRGTLVTIASLEEIVREAIVDVIETRPGDRVMLPEYGCRDYLFATINAGFASRLAFHLRRQILDYIPGVEDVAVTVEAGDAQQLEVSITYKLWGDRSYSFVYPLWQLRQSTT